MANPDNVRGSKEVEEVTSTQRWVLKVSIHCEACKRKVHKIISNIEGVERVDIDLKQHKVTVHGNVDPRMVIWKLEKAGKRAELWPQREKPVAKESKRQTKAKSRDKQSSSRDEDLVRTVQENSKGKEKLSGKGEAGDGEGRDAEDTRNTNGENGSKGGKGSLDGKASGGGEGETVQKPTVVESRADAAEKETVKPATTVPGGSQSSTDVNGGKIGDGNGGNKKNKGQDRKKQTCECHEVCSGENDAAAGGAVPGGPDRNNGSANQGPSHHPGVQRPERNAQSQGPNHVPPHEVFPAHNYEYYNYPQPPMHYYGPPVYAVNYHTARPASSYGAPQYYAPQPPTNSYHAYMHPGPEDHRPYNDPYQPRPSESFQLFSDENPNACSLM